MSQEEYKPSPEEQSELEKSRTFSDAQFLREGGKYVIRMGEKRLEVTEEQYEQAEHDMMEFLREGAGVKDPHMEPLSFMLALIKYRESNPEGKFPYPDDFIIDRVNRGIRMCINYGWNGQYLVDSLREVVKYKIPFNKDEAMEDLKSRPFGRGRYNSQDDISSYAKQAIEFLMSVPE